MAATVSRKIQGNVEIEKCLFCGFFSDREVLTLTQRLFFLKIGIFWGQIRGITPRRSITASRLTVLMFPIIKHHIIWIWKWGQCKLALFSMWKNEKLAFLHSEGIKSWDYLQTKRIKSWHYQTHRCLPYLGIIHNVREWKIGTVYYLREWKVGIIYNEIEQQVIIMVSQDILCPSEKKSYTPFTQGMRSLCLACVTIKLARSP